MLRITPFGALTPILIAASTLMISDVGAQPPIAAARVDRRIKKVVVQSTLSRQRIGLNALQDTVRCGRSEIETLGTERPGAKRPGAKRSGDLPGANITAVTEHHAVEANPESLKHVTSTFAILVRIAAGDAGKRRQDRAAVAEVRPGSEMRGAVHPGCEPEIVHRGCEADNKLPHHGSAMGVAFHPGRCLDGVTRRAVVAILDQVRLLAVDHPLALAHQTGAVDRAAHRTTNVVVLIASGRCAVIELAQRRCVGLGRDPVRIRANRPATEGHRRAGPGQVVQKDLKVRHGVNRAVRWITIGQRVATEVAHPRESVVTMIRFVTAAPPIPPSAVRPGSVARKCAVVRRCVVRKCAVAPLVHRGFKLPVIETCDLNPLGTRMLSSVALVKTLVLVKMLAALKKGPPGKQGALGKAVAVGKAGPRGMGTMILINPWRAANASGRLGLSSAWFASPFLARAGTRQAGPSVDGCAIR